MIENTNTKQFYPGPILNNTLEITDFLFNDTEQIKVTHSKFNEEQILVDVDLNYGTDYEVTKVLPSDINVAEAALTASTGQVIIKNINVLDGEKLTVYRLSELIQDKDYPRTGAFPAATHEGALDYLTMQNQEQQEELSRALKVPISTGEFNAAVPVPLPNRILRIDENATGFEFVPYDLDERLDTFEDTIEKTLETNKSETKEILANNKTELEGIIEDNKQEVLSIQADYQKEMDNKFQTVSDAAEKINELESAVDTAVAAADTATEQANLAIDSVQNIEATSDQLKEEITQEAEKQIENIQSTGFYMRNDNLYFINSKGEEEEFRAGGGGLTMFAHIWSDHIYNDVSYLRADTFSWHYASVYKTGYEELEKQYNNENCTLETENGITFKRTPDGFKIADITQQDAIRSLYENTGSAWYYIIDTENKCFKLPREKSEWELKGTAPVDVYGNGNTLVWTDGAQIYGTAVHGYVSGSARGVSPTKTVGAVGESSTFDATETWNILSGVNTDPKNSGLTGTVKLSNAIERKNTDRRKYLYFYVGQSKRPDTEVNLGQMGESLNNKVDLDAENYKGSQLETYINDTCINDKRTNCITEIPQRLNLVVENDVLVLKAGSIVTIPDGFEDDGVTPKFQYLTIDRDRTCGNVYNATTAIEIYYIAEAHPNQEASSSDGLTSRYFGYAYSGNTAPTSTYDIWYDTANNVIKRSYDNRSTWGGKYSLPLGKAWPIGDNTNKLKGVAMWQGMGYIGSTVWVEKDVKVLIPDGRNEDGTLKNIEYITDRVRTRQQTASNTTKRHLFLTHEGEFGACFTSNYLKGNEAEKPVTTATAARVFYAEDSNTMYMSLANTTAWEKVNFVEIATHNCSTTGVTSITPKRTFRAVDYNDIKNMKSYITESYQNGTSWYRVWSDGWIEQGGKTTISSSSGTTITFLKPFTNTNYWCMANLSATDLTAQYYEAGVVKGSKTITSMKILSKNYGSTDIREYYWEAKGY